jgi:hypothetical protein
MIIPLTGEKGSMISITENGKIVQVKYDGDGNLKKFFLAENAQQDKPHDAKFVVTDSTHGCADFTGSEGGHGYYSLGSENPGMVSVKFGTTFEDTQSSVAHMSFQDWADWCARKMFGIEDQSVTTSTS